MKTGKLFDRLATALLIIGAIIMLLPLYWVFAMAVRPRTEIFDMAAGFFPSRIVWDGFINLFTHYPVWNWIGNTVFVAVVSATLTVFFNLLAGYAFAKLTFWGREVLFVIILSTIMIPIQVVLVPEFMVINWLHLLNSPWGVILPRCAEAFGIFMARQFMLSIPNELLEAARLDGATEFQIFRKVVLPLCKPLISVLVVFAVVWRWNDFSWPLVVLTDQKNFMLQQGLNLLKGDPSQDWNSIMALAVICMAPMIVLFAFCQRFFVQGIAGSGLK
jgi:multiple sugar transport system permease protein/alpha-1,4-digalacturonate transport system permease protein